MRVFIVSMCDFFAVFPVLLLVVGLQALIGQSSWLLLVLLLAIPRAADTARLAIVSMEQTLLEPFVLAAKATGASKGRILLRHALPHAGSLLWVSTAITAATVVLAEAGLSFLGFGLPAPDPSWGELLKQAHENDLRYWLAVPAGVVLSLLALAFNALAQPTK